jgi:hypothetical protein
MQSGRQTEHQYTINAHGPVPSDKKRLLPSCLSHHHMHGKTLPHNSALKTLHFSAAPQQ